jgi:hypothetical protein
MAKILEKPYAAAPLGHQSAEPVGRKHRTAARIVGDRNPSDSRIIQQILSEAGQIARRIDRLKAARCNHFRAVIKPAGSKHVPVSDAFVRGNHVDELRNAAYWRSGNNGTAADG